MLYVRFWGDRGSIPCPGPATVRFGGNTSCLEIRADDRLVIVDLGTGIKPLGDRLMGTDFKKGPIDADIFITHTHWDHIMGFPMFTPIFVPGTKLRIRGPVSYEDDTLESVIGAQLSYKYWPVRQSELAAHIEYGQLKETELDLGGDCLQRQIAFRHLELLVFTNQTAIGSRERVFKCRSRQAVQEHGTQQHTDGVAELIH